MIKLSLCIPTYNRASFLPDLLQSILSQYDDSVEIIIVDNGSQDSTPDLISSWGQKLPLYYERFSQNQGPDRCFLRTIELATGSFCWLLGDDDILEPGALARILSLLQENLTGITLQRAAYDRTLYKRWIEPSFFPTTRMLTKKDLPALFPLLGFLSAQVVHRQTWLSVIQQEDLSPYYNAYCLVYIISRMIQEKSHWLYLHEPCVGWRSNNDSFAKELGRSGRLALDITSYKTIIQGLAAHSPKLRRSLLSQVITIHIQGHIRDLLFQYKEPFVLTTLRLLFPSYYLLFPFWTHILPLLCTPRPLARLTRYIYKRLKAI
ncbi:MAG: glycosyltransferase family 2 protein [Chlamydiae bacterium]|nr:glycosyltransferase family 2 protein [Chlamydiota bacterium]